MDYEDLLKAIIGFARTSEDIAGLVLFGSRATQRADQYSDVDLIVVTSDPARYQASEDWIERIGMHWLSFYEDTFGGGRERRVLFENALDADFLFFTRDQLTSMIKESRARELSAGFVILYDACGLDSLLSTLTVAHTQRPMPSREALDNLVNDFLFHTVWVAKKLLRGELWSAKSCVDCYMKQRLLTMMEWQARAVNGPDYQTGFAGRFVDAWADPSALHDLAEAFAHYNQSDVPRALMCTMDIFSVLAKDVGQRLGYPYPVEAEEKATKWVKAALALE